MSMATLEMPQAAASQAKKPKVEATNGVCHEGKLLVKKLSEHATVPTRGSSQAAGYDLYRQVLVMHGL